MEPRERTKQFIFFKEFLTAVKNSSFFFGGLRLIKTNQNTERTLI